jgi:hypothetical protein
VLGRRVKDGDRAARVTLRFLRDLLGDYRPRDFAVRLWDGTVWGAEPGRPERFTLVINHPGALRRMFWPPTELALAEAYVHDDFDIEGRIEAVFGLADHLLTGRRRGAVERLRFGARLLTLPSGKRPRAGRRTARLRGLKHSKARDRQAVAWTWRPPRNGSSTTFAASCGCGAASASWTSAAAGAGSSSTPRAATGWTLWASLEASRRPSWPTSASGKPGWPAAAGRRCATTGRSRSGPATTSWSASGCSSTWATLCYPSTSGGLIACSARAGSS